MRTNEYQDCAASPLGATCMIAVSNALATGEYWLSDVATAEQSSRISIEQFARPDTAWSKRIDAVEQPFTKVYDNEEYSNPALKMLNLAEFDIVASALAIQPAWHSKVKSELAGMSLLDVGCGTGRIALYAASAGATVTALDQTPGYVSATAAKMERLPLDVAPAELVVTPVEAGIASYADSQRTFDAITAMFAVLNHCEDWPRVIGGLAERLNPGGILVSSWYGSPAARVFQEVTAGLPYNPAILVRRVAGGLLLGDTADDVLPARFPYSGEVISCLQKAGLEVSLTLPLIPVTAFYPKQPNIENVRAYIATVSRMYGSDVADRLQPFNRQPQQLLATSLVLDCELATTEIDCAAYYGIVARKPDIAL